MNFLQLCNSLIIECGISAAPMVDVTSQTGELGRVVRWIQAAWIDIQSRHQDWQWMRKSTSFATIDGQAVYPVGDGLAINIDDFGMWAQDTFRNYVTADGDVTEVFMSYADYEAWRNAYQYGALRYTRSRPQVITITPDKSIGLGPVPAAGYTVTGDYYTRPLEMDGKDAVPALPIQFHMAIVYRAMMFYGGFEAAGEVYQRGEREFDGMMTMLATDRLPQIYLGGPLA